MQTFIQQRKDKIYYLSCFQLTKDEYDNLRSQIATSSEEYGGRRYLPYVFTEQALEKYGFKHCGVIYFLNGNPREAYQLMV